MSIVDGGGEKSEDATEALWDQRQKDSPATGGEDEVDLRMGQSMMSACWSSEGKLGEFRGGDRGEN